MKSVNAIFTFLLFLCPNITMAQQDSTSVSKNDSITWNKELDGVVVKAQRQLIKQDIDRIAYDVQADEHQECQRGVQVNARFYCKAYRGNYRSRRSRRC